MAKKEPAKVLVGKAVVDSDFSKISDEEIEEINAFQTNQKKLEFFLIECGGDIEFRDWKRSPLYLELEADYKSGELQKAHAHTKGIKPNHLITQEMLDQMKVLASHPETGCIMVPAKFPGLAAYVLYHAKYSACLPARLHPQSMELPDEYKNPERFVRFAQINASAPPTFGRR